MLTDRLLLWLLDQGWPGFIIAILIAAVGYQAVLIQSQIGSVRKENLELREFIRDLQEKRVLEVQAIAQVATKAITEFSVRAQTLLDALNQRGRK